MVFFTDIVTLMSPVLTLGWLLLLVPNWLRSRFGSRSRKRTKGLGPRDAQLQLAHCLQDDLHPLVQRPTLDGFCSPNLTHYSIILNRL